MLTQNKLFLSFKKNEMLPYAFAYLNFFCPGNCRWNAINSRQVNDIVPDFIIENYNGIELSRVAVMVKLNRKITAWHLRRMELNENFSAGCNNPVGKVFIVPGNCDTSLVPPGIKIIYLKESQYENTGASKGLC